MRELEYPFDSQMLLKKKKRLKRELLNDDFTRITKKIAILGGSTTSEVQDMLELFLLNFGIEPVFYASEYNKYYEDGMFDNPALVDFCPDIIYIHTSSRNILEWPEVTDSDEAIKEKEDAVFLKFRALWDHLFEKYGCPVIQNNFELPYFRLLGNQDAALPRGRVNFVSSLNLRFYEYAQKTKEFYIHDINYEAALYGLEKWSSPVYWNMYKYAMCLNAIPQTAYQTALIIKSLFGKNKKVLALDLDNTLWGGVIGDDGYENIEIGQETPIAQIYSEFQSYVKLQKQIGVLLTVISKNNEDTAKEGFTRPDSVLKYGDFVSFKANWDPKDLNLAQTADELNLLAESFVFADDNPAEREIVRQSLKGVAVPELTAVEQYISVIDKSGFFEVTQISEDDIKRSEMYASNAKRAKAMTSFADYGAYLDSLEMKAEIKPFESIYLSRIAQLTNKSNQFNLTTIRYTQPEIESMANDSGFITLYGKLTDKFGDNGVVSVVIGEIKDGGLHINLWLMSCRVLKRDMEFAMMDELVRAAAQKNLGAVYGYYYPTAKNSMVKEFYAGQGFEKISEDEAGNTVWKFDLNGEYTKKNKHIDVNGEE